MCKRNMGTRKIFWFYRNQSRVSTPIHFLRWWCQCHQWWWWHRCCCQWCQQHLHQQQLTTATTPRPTTAIPTLQTLQLNNGCNTNNDLNHSCYNENYDANHDVAIDDAYNTTHTETNDHSSPLPPNQPHAYKFPFIPGPTTPSWIIDNLQWAVQQIYIDSDWLIATILDSVKPTAPLTKPVLITINPSKWSFSQITLAPTTPYVSHAPLELSRTTPINIHHVPSPHSSRFINTTAEPFPAVLYTPNT